MKIQYDEINLNWHFAHKGKLYQYNFSDRVVFAATEATNILSETIVAVWKDKKFRKNK